MKGFLFVMAIAIVSHEVKPLTHNPKNPEKEVGAKLEVEKSPYDDLETYKHMMDYWSKLGAQVEEFVTHFPFDNHTAQHIKDYYLKLDKKEEEEYVNYDRHPDPHVVKTMFYTSQPLLIKTFFKSLIPIAADLLNHTFSKDYLLRMTNDYRASKKIAEEHKVFDAQSKLKQNLGAVEKVAKELEVDIKQMKANADNSELSKKLDAKYEELEKVAGEQLKVAKELYLSFAKFTSTFVLLEVDAHRLNTVLAPVESYYEKIKSYLGHLAIDEHLKKEFEEHVLPSISAEADKELAKDIISTLCQKDRLTKSIMHDVLLPLRKEPVSRKCVNKLEQYNDLMESFHKAHPDLKNIEASDKIAPLVKRIGEHIKAKKAADLVNDVKELEKETRSNRQLIDDFSTAVTKLSAGAVTYLMTKDVYEDDEFSPTHSESEPSRHRRSSHGRGRSRFSEEFGPEYDAFEDGFINERLGRERDSHRRRRSSRRDSKDEC